MLACTERRPNSRGYLEMTIDAEIELSRDAWGRLVLIDGDGLRFVGVEPVRAFPLTSPSLGISLCDEHGRELAWIDDLDAAPPAIHRILVEEFAAREFVPTILRIDRISGETDPSDWDVTTDRGATAFTLESDEQIRKLGKGRVLIADSRGLRYHISDTSALDAASRKLLDRFL